MISNNYNQGRPVLFVKVIAIQWMGRLYLFTFPQVDIVDK
jgi:hypothetical protein